MKPSIRRIFQIIAYIPTFLYILLSIVSLLFGMSILIPLSLCLVAFGQIVLIIPQHRFIPFDSFAFIIAGINFFYLHNASCPRSLSDLSFHDFGGPMFFVGIVLNVLLLFHIAYLNTTDAFIKKKTLASTEPKANLLHPTPKQSTEQVAKVEPTVSAPTTLPPSLTATPFLQACIDGNIEETHKLLSMEIVNQTYAGNGNTPLHIAVWNGHTDIVKLLLAQPNIDTQIKNTAGKTALDLAKEKNLTEIIDLLTFAEK